MVNIKDFGAIGNGIHLNTQSFSKAIEKAKSTGDCVKIPTGIYLTGTIDLKGVSLYLEKGATIKGSSSMEDYPAQSYVHNELGILRALIVCLEGTGVSITGQGTIDLNGSSFFDFSKPIVPKSLVPFSTEQLTECTHELLTTRPSQSIFFDKVTDLTISGITVLDAPCWTFTFSECTRVKVNDLTICTAFNLPNNDGMHFCSCTGIIVTNCFIESGDDCIAVSGITNWEKPCEDIVISDCVLTSCSKAIVLGYIYSHVRNVLINNVIIKDSNRGLCFMSTPGIGIVENVRVTNLIIDTKIRAGNWWGNGEPICFHGLKHDYHIPKEQVPTRSSEISFRNISLNKITCAGENAITAAGNGSNFENVFLEDIDISLKPFSKNLPLKGRQMDTAPATETIEIPENCGIYISKAPGIELKNIRSLNLTIIKE